KYVHVDTYAAVAFHPDMGDFWFVGAIAQPGRAQQEVLRRCNAAMGGGCNSPGEFSDAAIGFARDEQGFLWSALAGDPLAARNKAIAACSKYQRLACQWWTSRSSFDHDYSPDLTKRRYRYAIAVWEKPKVGHPATVCLATGRASEAEAEAAAMAKCRERESSHPDVSCTVANWVANGFIRTGVDETGSAYAITEVTPERAREATLGYCQRKGVAKCQLQDVYDKPDRGGHSP
ncbi:MAG: DUF4189 domain-containing protein, partial [Sphingomonadales bacterium]|nr:DUF4189 domain-containing protein [Sphingomonadales bacterium]